MAGKQYEVVRAFRQTDPKTGKDTHYEPGDPYSGSVDKPYEYLLDEQGPDGKGPLISEKSSSTDSSSKASSDSSGKEK